MKNKWKQKMIEKQNEKMKLQMKTQMKNKWKKVFLNISNLWLDANHITLHYSCVSFHTLMFQDFSQFNVHFLLQRPRNHHLPKHGGQDELKPCDEDCLALCCLQRFACTTSCCLQLCGCDARPRGVPTFNRTNEGIIYICTYIDIFCIIHTLYFTHIKQ